MFDDMAPSLVEQRLRARLAEWPEGITVVPPPCVVVVDLDGRRCAGPDPSSSVGPLEQQARLLEEGAGHLDALADLEAVLACAAAAQLRELAAFARCRPASFDRQPGETGAASAASRAARPAVLTEVSEWAAAEVAARLRLPQRVAQARLAEAVFLVEALPATVEALAAGAITPAHARVMADLLAPVSEEKRAEVETAALARAGTQTVADLRARVRRIVARVDAAAALRRLVSAARARKVVCYSGHDGTSTLAADLPAPLARACHEALTALAKACAVDDEGNPDPRSLDERMADCLADLILRPHADRPAVQLALTVVAGVDTLTGSGPGADEPGEVDGDLVPAPLVRELAHDLGLLPRAGAAPAPVPDGESAPVIATDPGDRRREPLHDLLAGRQIAGTALAHRPHIALADQLSGTLMAITDAVELRQAAFAGLGLGPPPPTDAYRPTDPLARFVEVRDRRCRFPGCRVRARCSDLDHQRPHPHGPTAHDNLACLCEHHHRLSHQAPGWRLRRDEQGGLVWTLPGGHTVTTHPPAAGTDDGPTTTVTPAPGGRVAGRRRSGGTLEAIRNWRPGTRATDAGTPF